MATYLKKINVLNYFLLLILFSACNKPKQDILVFYDNSDIQIDHAIDKLTKELESQDRKLSITAEPDSANVILKFFPAKGDMNEGYSITNNNNILSITANCNRGVKYGLDDLTEHFQQGKDLADIKTKQIQAQYPFRAIKFNLPWDPYRKGEHVSVQYETCRDLKFWEAFLDMMEENKFNTLSLWSLEPYSYMVKVPGFEKACRFTDEEFAEWQNFWKSLFRMARARGIDTYIVNWNIFVNKAFAENYDAGNYDGNLHYGSRELTPQIEEYTRGLITTTINEYEDLTGIGITLGERMGGMTSDQRRDWVDKTIIAGIKNADRSARLFYRAPLSAGTGSGGSTSLSAEQLTRETLETMDMDEQIRLGFKYNWSHGHSSPKVSIVHGGMLTDTYWEPVSDKYKGIWTVRNEDFFVLRYAQPDFIRSFIENNSQEYIDGCIIGSEGYIPAKDYITKAEHQKWTYSFERQWLFYKTWGNLLYNPETPDSYFEEALNTKFDIKDGHELLIAWKLASNSANRLASFVRSTWDGNLYSEGFLKNKSKLLTINELIKADILDSTLISISDYVNGITQANAEITPLQYADAIQKDCEIAMDIVSKIESKSKRISEELAIELTDIKAWTWHGRYFADKIRGGVAVAKYRKTNDEAQRQKAVEYLTNCLDYWNKLVEEVEKYNKPVIPYVFDQEFSWRKHITDVEKDIEIAKNDIFLLEEK